jgi:non-ribosomal peptide synthase protein (TIGR01720 family)
MKRVGVRDNFFELGGDSILSIQVVGRANQQGLRLTPKQLFQYPTIAELAAAADKASAIQAEQGLVTGQAPLTPIQHWFFEHQLPEPNHFNHAIMLEVRQALDASLLERAVQQLLAHHDALRLRFVEKESGWQQHIANPDGTVPFLRFDLTAVTAAEQSAAIEAKAAELQVSLSLSEGPLLRVALFDLGPQKPSRLLIIIHHLAVDGVAWRILLEDLMAGYQQLSKGEEVKLPPKTTSFKRWAQRLTEYAQSATLRAELDYWLAETRSQIAALPVDYLGDPQANTVAASRTVSVSLTVEETKTLLQEVPEAYHTQINDVLLAALVEAFAPWIGVRSLLVDLEGHGREAIFDDVDLSRTVGWFTSIFPVLLDAGKASGPGEVLKAIKEQLRAIPNRGLGYGLLRYLSGDKEIAAALQHLPHAEVSFNYLGQFDQILPESSPFASAPESTGPVHSPRGIRKYLLDINGFISGGRLQLEWSYSENFHRRATIEHLAQDYLAALRTLIAHCQSPEAGGYTPADFPLARLEQARLDWLVGTDRGIEDIYPLSPVQEGMLFYSLLAPESGVYVTQVIYELEGLNVSAMGRAWQRVLDRHPILRTAFVWKNLENPLQVVRRRVDLLFAQEDWRGLSPSEQKARLESFLKEDQRRGFELSQAPLMRMALFQVADETYQLVWSYHHLLLDGWSVPLLTKEFLGFYQAFDRGQDLHLERSRPYRDYIEWLQQQDLTKVEAFWRRLLEGFTSPTSLGADQAPRGPVVSGNGYAEQEIKLPEVTTGALQFFTRKHRLTQSTLVQGAWALLLCHYSGREDVLFGATLSGRPAGLLGAESMIGLFINTLPVRVQVSLDQSLLPWLKELQEQQAELRQYENSPLNEVQRWSEVPQDMPLFESIVVFENFPMDGSQSLQDQGQGLKFVNTDFNIRNNFPLTVRAVPGPQLLLKILYDSGRFDSAAVARILTYFEALLRKIVTQPEVRLAELIEKLAEADRQYQSLREKELKESRRQKLKNIRRKTVSEVQLEVDGET